MKISIILGHPDKKSFNHAIAHACLARLRENGHEVNFHDLHEENFDPLLPPGEIPKNGHVSPEVRAHCDEIAAADGIIVVHPNWWGMPPAILKGWVDRVLRPGIAYEFLEEDSGEGIPIGLLKARTALVFNTSNTPGDRERNRFGDPLEALWKDCIFDLCGVSTFYRKMFRIMVLSTEEQRKEWLEEARETVNRYFPG